jgi:hypothetical protein
MDQALVQQVLCNSMASIPPRCTREKGVSDRLEHTGRMNSRVSIEMTTLSPLTDQLGDIKYIGFSQGIFSSLPFSRDQFIYLAGSEGMESLLPVSTVSDTVDECSERANSEARFLLCSGFSGFGHLPDATTKSSWPLGTAAAIPSLV